MAADPAMWEAFIEHLENMVAERQEHLAPLESGEMKIGQRGAHTGGVWADITEPQGQSLRDEITSLRRTIERVRKEYMQKALDSYIIPGMRVTLTISAMLALAGCAHTTAPLATVSTPVSATVTGISIGAAPQPAPVVQTIFEHCRPPAVFMADPGPLAQRHRTPKTLTDRAAAELWLSDIAAFRSLRLKHKALSKWVREYCG